MDRKEFIKVCGLTCISGSALSVLLQSCAGSHYYAPFVLADNQLVIKKTEFVKTEKEKLVQRKLVLVRSERFAFPICVFKLSDENYSALLMECTHKGCELQPQGEYLICPCHGSEFSNTGIVQRQPAEQNLKSFQIKTDNENIYILL